MKTNVLARFFALAMNALFASIATVGVAVLMASSGVTLLKFLFLG